MSTTNYDLEMNGQRRRATNLSLAQSQTTMRIPTRAVEAEAEAERSLFPLEPLLVSLLVVLLFCFSPVLFSTSADDEVVSTRPIVRVSATALFLPVLPLSKTPSTLLTRVSPIPGPPRRAPVLLRLLTGTPRALPLALTSHSPTVLTLAW